jgi:hypothetical protein
MLHLHVYLHLSRCSFVSVARISGLASSLLYKQNNFFTFHRKVKLYSQIVALKEVNDITRFNITSCTFLFVYCTFVHFVADSNQIAVSYCIGSVEFRYSKSSGH